MNLIIWVLKAVPKKVTGKKQRELGVFPSFLKTFCLQFFSELFLKPVFEISKQC
jgi:hypothetical protein